MKKLYLWLRDPLDRLKWLSILIDATSNLKGGALASALYAYVASGSPLVRPFIARIYKEVSGPLVGMVR